MLLARPVIVFKTYFWISSDPTTLRKVAEVWLATALKKSILILRLRLSFDWYSDWGWGWISLLLRLKLRLGLRLRLGLHKIEIWIAWDWYKDKIQIEIRIAWDWYKDGDLN